MSKAPAVVVHGLRDVRAALAPQRPLTLLSAPAAAVFAGCGWWKALAAQARAESPGLVMADILDCGEAAGLALAAIRIGQRCLILDARAPGWRAVAAIAAEQGLRLLSLRPAALDLADRGAARRLRQWLTEGPPA